MVENYQVLSDNVYTNTQGYVKSYTVIGESKTPALYQVNVRAVVAIGTIKNDLDALGLLHVKAEKPRVLFMIAEQNVGDKYYTFWWWGKREFMGETIDMSAAETRLGAFPRKGLQRRGYLRVDGCLMCLTRSSG